MGHEIALEKVALGALATGERHVEEDDCGGRVHVHRPRRPGFRPARFHKPWTPAEDKVLLLEWGEVSPRVLKAKLRGRSWSGIYNRAIKVLHLPYGFPQGTVSIKEAARRLGYANAKSVAALAVRQSVAIRLHPTPPTLELKRNPHRCVDWQDIHDAYLREANTTETIKEGALRHGLVDVTLARWLRQAEVLGPKQGHGQPQRVPSADIDRVVAAHRGQP